MVFLFFLGNETFWRGERRGEEENSRRRREEKGSCGPPLFSLLLSFLFLEKRRYKGRCITYNSFPRTCLSSGKSEVNKEEEGFDSSFNLLFLG